jgi:single-strand DNA-binding protein
MNVCVFSGNLGRDAEVKQVGEHTVTTFSLAVKSGYGEKATTFWLNCNWWNRARFLQSLTKGSRVVVSGELSLREYAKKDGTPGQSLELRVIDLDLTPKSDGSGKGQRVDADQNPMQVARSEAEARHGVDPTEKIPF